MRQEYLTIMRKRTDNSYCGFRFQGSKNTFNRKEILKKIEEFNAAMKTDWTFELNEDPLVIAILEDVPQRISIDDMLFELKHIERIMDNACDYIRQVKFIIEDFIKRKKSHE
ncbi:MAG: hypothetical protein LBU09_03210 [Endomicrobium sp.]|jgi:uncharacterized surface anchored protein|nr:hypothetical protein [Endomicrobium sp.]